MLRNKTKLNNEINPFNIQWLAENFKLNTDDVVKAAFDPLRLNIIYERNLLTERQRTSSIN